MPKITFPSTDQSYEVEAGTSMLDFCQSNDTPVPFGCTTGACGTCASVMVAEDGALNPADEDEVELLEHTTDAPGARLACQVTINGDVTVTPV
jgi:adenylate cyclase